MPSARGSAFRDASQMNAEAGNTFARWRQQWFVLSGV